MKYFEHTRVQNFEEASQILKNDSEATVIAGATDILSVIRNEILTETPKMVVDIKNIVGADEIRVEDNTITIGSLARLTTIAENHDVLTKAPALAEAAHSVATPLIRNLGTIGGNICQDVRCWFYRYPHEAGNRLICRRKGGETCYALQGDNRYHSVFGGMKCGSTPCSQRCPASTDIPGYMEQFRLGNVPGAVQIIMSVNPIPCITSRVCAHFCQEECSHSSVGDSVAIRNVERFVGDYALDHKNLFYRAPILETGKKVAVIGSGPAGLSAAYYLRKAGNAVTVYDSKEEPGGMLMYAIPDYRLPKAIVRKLVAALKDMGIQFVCNTKIGESVKPGDLERDFDSVYYATGTWKRPVLGLAGEELTVFGLDFLVEVHKWMGGKVGQEVLVTGGGNVAMDVAITAKRLGAKKVIMACLESEDIMPAGKEEIARAREEGIQIMPGWGLSKVVSENGKVRGMELIRCMDVYDENHRFSPVYDDAEKTVVDAENILMAVGQNVDLSFLDEKYQLQLNARGLIDVEEETQMTSRQGVFAGGDVTTGPSTVIQCVMKGHSAARGINKYLGVTPDHECSDSMQIASPFLTFDLEGIKNQTALKLAEIPIDQRSLDVEDEIAPDQAAALTEARRCMNCGCYAVEPSDITPVLVALGGTIKTTERVLTAEEFCCTKLKVDDVLRKGELVTEITIPVLEGAIMHYDKFRLRESIDWAIVSLATAFGMERGRITAARVVLGGVAPIPVRLNALEGYLLGREIDDETILGACDLAVKECLPMWKNKYKVQEIKALVGKALLRLK
ncbi:FAD binding domain-containing protein [Dehalobacter sp. DCM]|uniref:FAD-dependent oxidoreductase n=1 Tax=Dehalobacter sp. DCM TaxID=2907827 RepID=UPI003081DB46|nr:FAD binding domain-containing protein [Dehalobacter sp. DCM]